MHLLCERDRGCFWLGKGKASRIILLASVFHIEELGLFLLFSFTMLSALQVYDQGKPGFWLPRRMN